MRFATIATTLALTAGVGGVAAGLAQAVQLKDGTVYFAQPPRLVEATTTLNDINDCRARNPTVNFSVSDGYTSTAAVQISFACRL